MRRRPDIQHRLDKILGRVVSYEEKIAKRLEAIQRMDLDWDTGKRFVGYKFAITRAKLFHTCALTGTTILPLTSAVRGTHGEKREVWIVGKEFTMARLKGLV